MFPTIGSTDVLVPLGDSELSSSAGLVSSSTHAEDVSRHLLMGFVSWTFNRLLTSILHAALSDVDGDESH